MKRTLKVEPISSLTAKPAAKLRLKGHWLAALGFEPGRRVVVEQAVAMNGLPYVPPRLTIRLETPDEAEIRIYEAAIT